MNGYIHSLLAPPGSNPYWSMLGMAYSNNPLASVRSTPEAMRNVADDPAYRAALIEAMRPAVMTPEIAAFQMNALRNSDEAIAWNKRGEEVQEDWSI